MAESWDRMGQLEERIAELEKHSHPIQDVVPAEEIRKMVETINAEFVSISEELVGFSKRLEDLERQAKY